MSKISSICAGCGQTQHHPAWKPFKYCNNKCQSLHRKNVRDNRIRSGENASTTDMKNFLLEQIPRQCSNCFTASWCGTEIPLELEHKDGNHQNNTIDNCVLLCPNCHALTPTYKNKNKGNGRAYRRERYHLGKTF